MSVILETSLGDLTVDLFIDQVPVLAANFIKLCKLKQYNNTLFHSIEKNFIARGGIITCTSQPLQDPGSILTRVKENDPKAYAAMVQTKGQDTFYAKAPFDVSTGLFHEMFHPKLKHQTRGTLSMANPVENAIGCGFFITLRDSIDYLDNKRSIIGLVVEGFDVLDALNNTFVEDHVLCCPLKPIRILHTIILDDPFPDPPGSLFHHPISSPLPLAETVDPSLPQDTSHAEDILEKELSVFERIARSEAKSRAVALEILGDLPDADLTPPDNVLFVCKLNPITEAKDLQLIFARFGEILSCEIIRDWKTGDSLQYGFIEFKDPKSCETALFKMEGCLIDDRRIHVDFCQSVSKQWAAYQRYGPRLKKTSPSSHTSNYDTPTSHPHHLNQWVFPPSETDQKMARSKRHLPPRRSSRSPHRSKTQPLHRRKQHNYSCSPYRDSTQRRTHRNHA